MRHDLLTASAAFKALRTQYALVKTTRIADLFTREPARFDTHSIRAAGLFLDYSKNLVDDTTLRLLLGLAQERGVEEQRDAMFAGEKINFTEQRAVLHTALRAPLEPDLKIEGQYVSRDVHTVLERMRVFSERVRLGEWLGHTGKPITDIVNIGIGGSDLGPKMVCRALRAFTHPRLHMHFVSNVDGHDLAAILSQVNPETTLFIITSKTFTTMETMMNAQSARNWFLQHGDAAGLPKHFVAVSTNQQSVREFGIHADNMFPFWDWVGGRYSVWSAIGLPIALAVGFDYFSEFLHGAYEMDTHFRTAPLSSNMPVVLALVGLWNRNFVGCSSLSIAPYQQDLQLLPAFLQQLEMESNGKHITADGSTTEVATCPLIWGDVGTNGQHAYFQLLHQGTDITPVDFIAALKPNHTLQEHHAALLANCFAQSEAFMRGKSADEVRAEMVAQGVSADTVERLVPHRTFEGNCPSNTILMNVLNPATIGALIALYEHKVFAQGVIWGVNSFDQWGVELGKVLAKNIQSELSNVPNPQRHDSSTNGLIALARSAL
ncbi:MAG TPA: glucose-6-phosphate isomerase [Burkholderiaceae bacterium]|jgi:glucose-6-phosphate isomerase